MKKQLLFASVLLCGTMTMLGATVQSIVVQSKSGTDATYTLSNVRKITFSGSTMSVIKTDATESDYTLSNVQKLLFGTSTSAINEISSNVALKAYPNPVKDILNIEGIGSIDNIHLYNLTGSELAMSFNKTDNGVQINTSSLPQGIYLLQINNQVIKFQK